MKFLFVAAGVLAISAMPVSAAVVTLTFEGVGDLNPVGNYYAPDYIFSSSTLALVDQDAGGSGNFANEPSANTIMFFLDSNNAILNAPNGFTTGFSFFYSSSVATTITVYDGLNGTGNVLGTLGLTAQGFDNCTGDPNGSFCNWTAVGVSFSGTAFSIDFAGGADVTGFDNITFGSATPGGVPEAGTWAMLIAGFGMVGFASRRRRTIVSA